jgi:hypothetical protein
MQSQHSYKEQQQDAQAQDSRAQRQEWPNDFNLRAEAAEQQEVVRAAKTWQPHQTPPLSCSEYDF